LRRNALALLGASALLLTAGCAGEGGSSASAAGSSTPSASGEAVLSATTAAGADAQVHQLLTEVLGAVRPKVGDFHQGEMLSAASTGLPKGRCGTPGRVQHEVSIAMMSAGPPGSTPDIGLRARNWLEARGWRFGGWQSEGSVKLARGHRAGYTVTVLDTARDGSVQLMGVPPCLPGTPIATPSFSPDRSAQ
jgi:hypothetical protein